MTAIERRRHKAAEYRERAQAAAQAAESAGLESVRVMHSRAEQRWTELAEVEDAHLQRYETAALG
jgi:hypothetical protein